jgi:CheY-like chemotaxis protein
MQYDSRPDTTLFKRAKAEPRRVLVADDDPVSQHVVTLLLDRLGYQRDLVTDGDAVLTTLARQSYEIILLDLSMPGLHGIEVAQRIRKREGDRATTMLIAISASGDALTRDRCASAGIDAFLEKPIGLHALDLTLQRATRHVAAAASAGLPAAASTGASGEPTDDCSLPQVRAQLRRYVGDDSPAVVQQAIAVYVSSAQRLLGQMRLASASQDWNLLRRCAHSLMGSSRLLGAFRLAALCAELESGSLLPMPARKAEALRKVESQFDRVLIGLQAL